MGIGPLIAWRKTSLRALARTLSWPIVVTIACGLVLAFVGAGSSTPGIIAYSFSAFVLATIVLEFVRGTRATGSLFVLIARNRRRYGGYIVHAAIVLLAIGIAGSSAYGTNVEQRLARGQSVTVARVHAHEPRHHAAHDDAREGDARRCSTSAGRGAGESRPARTSSSTRPSRRRRSRSRRTGCGRRICT